MAIRKKGVSVMRKSSANKYRKLGDLLRSAREKIGYSQSAFADKVGVERSYLSRMEKGERRPSTDALRMMSQVLQIPLKNLMELAGHSETAEKKPSAPVAPAPKKVAKPTGKAGATRYAELGELIRKTREKFGYSQGAFADKVNVERSYLSRMEKGERRASPEDLRTMSQILQIPLRQLLELAGHTLEKEKKPSERPAPEPKRVGRPARKSADLPFASLGNLLRTAREKLGYTQTDFAKRIGMERSYLSRLEQGQRRPSPKTLRKFSQHLQVPLKELLEHAGFAEPEGMPPSARPVPAVRSVGRPPSKNKELPFRALGELLRKTRQSIGYSQTDFAKKIGMERSYLSRLEQGERRPSIKTLRRFSQYLQVPLRNLLEHAGFAEPEEKAPVTPKPVPTAAPTAPAPAFQVRRPRGRPRKYPVTAPPGTLKAGIQGFRNLRITAVPVFDEVPAGLASGKLPVSMEGFRMLLLHEEELAPDPNAFGMKVKGDSMSEAGIFDGDTVVVSPNAPVKDGDTVVVDLGRHDISVKTVYFEGDRVYLVPANRSYKPIHRKFPSEVDILGKVVSVRRNIT